MITPPLDRIYLDMCCFKRPFDDQRQPRSVHGFNSKAVDHPQIRVLDSGRIRVRSRHGC